MEFSKEYWSWLPFANPGDLPDPGGIKPPSLVSLALAGRFFSTEPPGKPIYMHTHTHTHTFIVLTSHANKVMLKILQARLQQYVNSELPDVQARFRKGTRNRDQIENIHWILEKAREFQ